MAARRAGEALVDIGTEKFPRTKRFDDEERKCRIFDAKRRIIGVDVKAFDAQVDEQKRITEAENKLDAAWDEAAIFFDQERCNIEQERRHVARTINKEEVVFRREHQDITSRREFDIYDPDLLKKSLPPRIDDSAKNNPPSSLKMLAGEDLQYEERIKCQQQQQERWLTDHLEETDCARERDLRERAQTEEMLLAQDEYAMYLADNDRRIRHEINCDYARAHLCQAEEKRQKEQEAWEEEQRANEEEICLTNTSAFMTEDPCVQINRIQPHRYRKDHYKSMPPRAKQRIMCEREQQVCDVKVSRQVQLSAELEYAREQEMIRRLLVQKNAELACLRRQMKIELAQQLKKMSICKKIKDKIELKEIHTNEIRPEFHTQFGTRSR